MLLLLLSRFSRQSQKCALKRPIKPKSYIVTVQCLVSFRIKLVILSSWDMPIFMRAIICDTVYVLSCVLIQ